MERELSLSSDETNILYAVFQDTGSQDSWYVSVCVCVCVCVDSVRVCVSERFHFYSFLTVMPVHMYMSVCVCVCVYRRMQAIGVEGEDFLSRKALPEKYRGKRTHTYSHTLQKRK